VDLWVALINPVARVQHESAFRKIPDWFGPEITLDPRSSNFPCCETGVESTGFVRIPRKSRLYIDRGDIHTVLFPCRGIVSVVVPPRRLVEQQYGCKGAVRRRRAVALLTLIGAVARLC
jgi:hypothetical protein